MKTDRINITQFDITSVQDDHSEIKLSSGRISVDLLHKKALSKDEGIFNVTLKLFHFSCLKLQWQTNICVVFDVLGDFTCL